MKKLSAEENIPCQENAKDLKLKLHKTKKILRKEIRIKEDKVDTLKDKVLYYEYENNMLEMDIESKIK